MPASKSIPYLPLATPFFDDNGGLTRPWIIALQNLGSASAAASQGTSNGSGVAATLQVALPVADPIASGIASPGTGLMLAVEILQDASGGNSITWGAEFAPDTPTDISATADAVTRFLFVYYGDFFRCHAFYAQP